MRASIIARCGLIGLVVGASVAHADTRTTTSAVTLRKKPGEKEAATGSLPIGAEVVVVREEGRWLWVRAGKLEGYLTRTTVTAPASATDAAPPAPVWSAPRRRDGAVITDLFVAISAPTASLRAQPSATAAAVIEVARGQRLAVIDAATDPQWIHARDDQGHDGWIARADVDDGAVTGAIAAAATTVAIAPTFTRGAPRRLALRTSLGVGYRTLGMDFTSNVDGGLHNFIVDADAAALGLDADAIARRAGRWFVALDARAQLSDASPGIDYPGPTSAPGVIPFRTFAADLGARAGLRVGDAIDLAARVGGHYDAFLTGAVDNAGALPRERLLGVTIGVAAEIAPPHSKFSATARVDALPIGWRAQTPGLQDGTASTARAVWGGVTVRYALTRRWALCGGVELGRASTTWTGPSMRAPGVTHAHRVDTTQLLQLGIGAEL